MKNLLNKISRISSMVAVFAGFLLALGTAFKVFDTEFKKHAPEADKVSEPE